MRITLTDPLDRNLAKQSLYALWRSLGLDHQDYKLVAPLEPLVSKVAELRLLWWRQAWEELLGTEPEEPTLFKGGET